MPIHMTHRPPLLNIASDRWWLTSHQFLGVVLIVGFLVSRINFAWLIQPWSSVDPELVMSRSSFGADAYELTCDAHWVIIHQDFVRYSPDQSSPLIPFEVSPAPSEMN
jgi:hypothetical protein